MHVRNRIVIVALELVRVELRLREIPESGRVSFLFSGEIRVGRMVTFRRMHEDLLRLGKEMRGRGARTASEFAVRGEAAAAGGGEGAERHSQCVAS